MKAHSEKQPSENRGTRRADRISDQGGRRSEQAEKARKAHGTEAPSDRERTTKGK